MRIFYGAILALVVLAIGGVAVIYSGAYNVAASDEHSALGKWVTHTTMHNSVKEYADNITVPDLNDTDMIKQGAGAYNSMCVACHLKPGLEGTALRAGLNPMPPNLTEQNHWEPGEQFWIVKHGIKMTGMPSWGATHEDEELWEVVAFLQKLPELSEQEYSALVSPNKASGKQTDKEHGQDDGHDHQHGNMSGMMGASESGAEETEGKKPGGESASPAPGEAEPNDHYADGHTH